MVRRIGGGWVDGRMTTCGGVNPADGISESRGSGEAVAAYFLCKRC